MSPNLRELSDIELSERFLLSLIDKGGEGWQKLPPDFRSTVLPLRCHQDIWKVIELLHKNAQPIDLTSVARHADHDLANELALLSGNVLVSSYLNDGQLEEAAGELIRRAEVRDLPVDKRFREMTSDDLEKVLGLTVKKDRENKIITFLAMTSAYTGNSQLNVSYNAPSSTGKSYIPLELAQIFAEDDVLEIGYASPTSFFHDTGHYDKPSNTVLVDLARKILIFLDQPHQQLLEHLRPLLSHDRKEIKLKITDKNQKGGLRTKNVLLRGFPSVIFCTASLKIEEQESTRFLLLSPDTTQEKVREGILEKIRRESNASQYAERLEADPARQLLRERMKAIKAEKIEDINLRSPEEIQKRFFERTPILKPRHQRDIARVISLIKSFALLNLWFREREGNNITASQSDTEEGFQLWDVIAEPQELSLPPFVYELYTRVILPRYRELNKNPLSDTKIGLSRLDILRMHHDTYGRVLPDWILRRQIIPMLESSGLVSQETDPNDKRRTLVFPTLFIETKSQTETTNG